MNHCTQCNRDSRYFEGCSIADCCKRRPITARPVGIHFVSAMSDSCRTIDELVPNVNMDAYYRPGTDHDE